GAKASNSGQGNRRNTAIKLRLHNRCARVRLWSRRRRDTPVRGQCLPGNQGLPASGYGRKTGVSPVSAQTSRSERFTPFRQYTLCVGRTEERNPIYGGLHARPPVCRATFSRTRPISFSDGRN